MFQYCVSVDDCWKIQRIYDTFTSSSNEIADIFNNYFFSVFITDDFASFFLLSRTSNYAH